MDMLQEYVSIFIVIACNVFGFMLKNFSFLKWINNDDIPALLCLIGGVLGLMTVDISLHAFITGCVSGIASVGLYEAFLKNLLGTDSSH